MLFRGEAGGTHNDIVNSHNQNWLAIFFNMKKLSYNSICKYVWVGIERSSNLQKRHVGADDHGFTQHLSTAINGHRAHILVRRQDIPVSSFLIFFANSK